jgi:hypothetical protein
MAKLDFAKAKADVAEIVDIVKAVPENLQVVCFEMLFEAAFSGVQAPTAPKEEAKPEVQEKENPPATDKKLPSNVLAFAIGTR